MSSNQNQSSYTQHFNDNKTGQRDRNTSFRPMHSDIQSDDTDFMQDSSTSTTTSGSGSSSGQGWNQGSRYSFTASDLAHPDEHTSPDE